MAVVRNTLHPEKQKQSNETGFHPPLVRPSALQVQLRPNQFAKLSMEVLLVQQNHIVLT